jgi:hypothetical protein
MSKIKSFNCEFKMLDLNCLTAFSLKVRTVSFDPRPYSARIDKIDQKQLSITFSLVKPKRGASLPMFGGMVLRNDGFGNSMGNEVYNVHG